MRFRIRKYINPIRYRRLVRQLTTLLIKTRQTQPENFWLQFYIRLEESRLYTTAAELRLRAMAVPNQRAAGVDVWRNAADRLALRGQPELAQAALKRSNALLVQLNQELGHTDTDREAASSVTYGKLTYALGGPLGACQAYDDAFKIWMEAAEVYKLIALYDESAMSRPLLLDAAWHCLKATIMEGCPSQRPAMERCYQLLVRRNPNPLRRLWAVAFRVGGWRMVALHDRIGKQAFQL